jgi:hypothetical protein
MKRASKVLSAISLFAAKEKRGDRPNPLDSKEVDVAFEELLVRTDKLPPISY